jgi:GT2 family glycosyltransferase
LDDLAVIVVSYNSERWIASCLGSISAHMGEIDADVVVVDAESRDATVEVVAEFDDVRLIPCRNGGFAYANNRGLMTCDARYVLFLNPDTEILEGRLSELVQWMDEHPAVGLVGAKQVDGEGSLDMTIRRFPNALRAFGDALSAERLPRRPRWLGERELDPAAYDHEVACDWTSGSFMLARREAIESAGFLDERFFMYSEETDLCRRIRSAGWEVRHLPSMTILHYGAQVGVDPTIESLSAYNRVAYARKHFSPVHLVLYYVAVLLRHLLRTALAGRGDLGERRRTANWAAVKTLVGRAPVPYGPPSRLSVNPEDRPDPPADRSARRGSPVLGAHADA